MLGISDLTNYLTWNTTCKRVVLVKSCNSVSGGDTGKFSGPQTHVLYFNLAYCLLQVLGFIIFSFNQILLKTIWPPDEPLEYHCCRAKYFRGLQLIFYSGRPYWISGRIPAPDCFCCITCLPEEMSLNNNNYHFSLMAWAPLEKCISFSLLL